MDDELVGKIGRMISDWGAATFSELYDERGPYDHMDESQLARLIIALVRDSK